jgi:hypothetical protein
MARGAGAAAADRGMNRGTQYVPPAGPVDLGGQPKGPIRVQIRPKKVELVPHPGGGFRG